MIVSVGSHSLQALSCGTKALSKAHLPVGHIPFLESLSLAHHLELIQSGFKAATWIATFLLTFGDQNE